MDIATYAATAAHQAQQGEPDVVERKTTRTSSFSDSKVKEHDPEVQTAHEGSQEHDEKDAARWAAARPLLRPTILFALAAGILGWWICSTILKDTRHRWIVQTFWAWFFIM